MKKTRVLGLALTLAASMVVGSAMGQIKTDYTDMTTAGGDNSISYISAGAKLRYYALPDPAFSTAYVKSSNTNITKGITWTWTIDAGATIGAATTFTSAAALGDGTEESANYVEITAGNAAAISTVTYNENAISTALNCNGDAKTFELHIFPLPTSDLNTQTAPVSHCGTYTLTASDLILTASATDKIDVVWQRDVQELAFNASLGTLVPTGTATNTALHYSNATTTATPDNTDGLTWAYANGTAYKPGTKTPLVLPANGTHTLTASGDLAIKTGHKVGTMYKYYFKTTDGVNDFVSRKSEYLAKGNTVTTPANCTRYKATTTHEVIFYVLNRPTTGPVYHVANAFAN